MVDLFLAGLAGGIGACFAMFIFKSNWEIFKTRKAQENFIRNHWLFIVPSIIFVLTVPFIPWIFKHYEFFGFAEKTKIGFSTGTAGDTFGGLTAPFIGTVVGVLTFLAFWVQYRANEQQKKDLKVERFENKYYKMIDLHKSNVNEMAIGKIIGRNCFVPMFYELKKIYEILENEWLEIDINKANNVDYDLMSLAYHIFFYGIGENSEKHYLHKLDFGDRRIFDKALKTFKDTKLQYEKGTKTKLTYDNLGADDEIKIFRIKPFEGHANILGHYYRHLVHTVVYISEQDFNEDKIINKEMQHSYIKSLRAQLSNFEQLLLYYNGIAWFDKLWTPFFVDFRFIKNLPLALADFGANPEVRYKEDIERLAELGIKMFENQSTPIKILNGNN